MAKRGIRFNFREKARLQLTPGEGGDCDPIQTAVLAYTTATADTPSEHTRIQFFTDELVAGAVTDWTDIFDDEWTWRIIPDEDGFVVIPIWGWKLQRYDRNGNLDWEWEGPDFENEWLGWDAAVDAQRNVYFLASATHSVHKLNASGVEQWSLTEADDWGAPDEGAEPVSIALSQDHSVIFLQYNALSSTDDELAPVIGVDAVTGEKLWEFNIQQTNQTEGGGIRTVPGSNAFYVTAAIPRSGKKVGAVLRYDFLSGVRSAPTLTWSDDWNDEPTLPGRRYIRSLVVTEDAVFIGGDAAPHDGQSNYHLVVKYAHDGSILWRHEESHYDDAFDTTNKFFALSVIGDRVVVGVEGDNTRFTTEGKGWIALNASTGVMVSEGAFPLEAEWVLAAATVATTCPEALTTWDGLPLTAWDGEPLTTWEN